VLQRPDLILRERSNEEHCIISNEAVAKIFRSLAQRLQGVVTDDNNPNYAPHLLEVYVKRTEIAKSTGDRI
jgi:hypothetical protein